MPASNFEIQIKQFTRLPPDFGNYFGQNIRKISRLHYTRQKNTRNQLNIHFFFLSGTTAQRGPGPPHSWGFYFTHNDTPQSVALLWTSDRPVAETSIWLHRKLTRNTSMPTSGLQTANPASELGQWDQHWMNYINKIHKQIVTVFEVMFCFWYCTCTP